MPVICVFTMALWGNLKSGMVIVPAEFLLFMVVLDIWGLLYFHMNFKIVFFFNFCAELHCNFYVDCIESVD